MGMNLILLGAAFSVVSFYITYSLVNPPRRSGAVIFSALAGTFIAALTGLAIAWHFTSHHYADSRLALAAAVGAWAGVLFRT